MKNKRNRGFTLIELIVVLAVLGIIALIAVPKYMTVKAEAMLKADYLAAKNIRKAEYHYYQVKLEHSFNPAHEQTEEKFMESIEELDEYIHFKGFQVAENPRWEYSEGQWYVVFDYDGASYIAPSESVDEEILEEDEVEEAEEIITAEKWDKKKDHYDKGDRVEYKGGIFEALYWTNKKPGNKNAGWQEITDEWRAFNIYDTGDIVEYKGRQYEAIYYSSNKKPGTMNSGWYELTDEWRKTNPYQAGSLVFYNGSWYEARWYSLNNKPKNNPGHSDPWKPVE